MDIEHNDPIMVPKIDEIENVLDLENIGAIDLVTLSSSMVDKFKNVRSIDLNSQLIIEVERDAFHKIKRLESINLSNNLISNLDNDLFVNNPYLKEVILANNLLTSINKYLFLQVKKLTYLNLSFNLIAVIDEFSLFSFCLTHLNLSNNKIQIVNPDAFFYTSKLVYLNLSNNQLPSLEIGVQQLQYLDASNNPISYLQVDSTCLKTMLLNGHQIKMIEHCFHQSNQFLTELNLFTDVGNGIQNVNENCFKGTSLLRVLSVTVYEMFDFSSLNCLLLLSSFCLRYTGERNLTPEMRSIGDFLSGKTHLESLWLVFGKFYTCYFNRIGKLVFLQTIHIECLNAISVHTDVNVALLFKQNVTLKNISLINLNYFVVPETCDEIIFEIPESFRVTTNLVLIGLQNLTITNYFRIFSQLEHLNLSNGGFVCFGINVFQDLINLKKLYIDNSKLTFIPATLFMHNILLETLSLSNNHIVIIEDYSFYNLKNLKLLELRGNRLSLLNRHTFYDLGSIGTEVKLDDSTIQSVLNCIQ